MKITKRVLLFFMCILISFKVFTPAFADYPSRSSLTLSPFFGGYLFNKEQHLQNNVRPFYGLRVGGNFSQNLGIEAMFGNIDSTSSDFGNQEINIFRYGLEAIIRFMPNKPFMPFIALGGGGITYDNPNGIENRSKGLVDYGVGFLVGLSDRAYIRTDLRHIVLMNTDEDKDNFEGTFGLAFVLGGDKKVEEKKEAPATPAPVVVAPDVVSTHPSNGTKGVGTNISISANFNVALDPTSVTPQTFVLKHGTILVPGTLASSAETITFTPNQELNHNTTYIATATIGIQGINGVPLEKDYQWSFTTSAIVEKKSEVALVLLDDAYFSLDKSSRTKSLLNKKGKNILKNNIQIMKDNPQVKINIIGYTSSKGTKNLRKLSIKRANAVRNYLVEESGISQQNLITTMENEQGSSREFFDKVDSELNTKDTKESTKIKGKKILFQITEK
ncbi:MAG: Ig-like domain-containing protein [Oligoflexia bacterium]|nr:Ig-like domain-containing protein [Oligoflexia bacterium]